MPSQEEFVHVGSLKEPETMESCQYRGYQIETRHEWSSWCVSIYRTHSNIPILPQPTLHISAPLKDDVVAVAKRSIDQVLSNPAGILA